MARFFRWWFSELGSLVPAALAGRPDAGQWLAVEFGEARVRAVLAGPRERVLLDLPVEQAGELGAQLADAVAGLDPRRLRLRVSLPRRQVLVREFELPLAAQENLREVLAFEMSRRTPFRAEDVHFDYQVVARDAGRQVLSVRLEVAPRSALAPALSGLGAWELEPIQVPAPVRSALGAGHCAFAFRPAAFRDSPHVALNTVLALLVAGLLVAAAWQPLAAQRSYREELDRELDAARVAATQASALRDELAAERDARALISDARHGRPSMVELLDELTRVLPDGTFLFRLEAKQGEVNLHGSSEGASGLIAILEAAPHLDKVRFASPVTRDGATGRERFHIVAVLEGDAGPGPTR